MNANWVDNIKQDATSAAGLDRLHLQFLAIIIQCTSKAFKRFGICLAFSVITVGALDPDVA